MDRGEEGAKGGGGAQTAKRRGGRTDTGSSGDASGKRRRKSGEIARKRYRFIPLVTKPRRVGAGYFVEVLQVRHGEPREREGGGPFWILVATIKRWGDAVARIEEDIGWIPAAPAPTHKRLAKSGGGPGFQFYLFPRVLREAARRGYGEPGGRPVVALMSLSWFATLRVGEAASIRVVDIRGEKALGFCVTKRGIMGRRWRRWSEWSRAWLGGYLREYRWLIPQIALFLCCQHGK